MTLGQFIKTTRAQRGMTQEELAKKLFVSPRSVQSWEQQWRIPRLPTLSKLARTLQVPPNRLLQFVTLSDHKRVG